MAEPKVNHLTGHDHMGPNDRPTCRLANLRGPSGPGCWDAQPLAKYAA